MYDDVGELRTPLVMIVLILGLVVGGFAAGRNSDHFETQTIVEQTR